MHAPTTPPVASVLVVDDSALQRQFSVQVCRSIGIATVHEAGSGLEALALLDTLAEQPQLVIVDLEMPGMDGVEFIQQLQPRGVTTPLLVASSREPVLIHTVEAMARNLGLPVLGGLQKPLTPASLLGALSGMARPGSPAAGTSGGAMGPAAPGDTVDRDTLAAAIAAGALDVHYQPKVDMQTGIVRGVEALARWQHKGVFVPPGVFVALAERWGLVHALTLSVLDKAVAQAAVWNSRGLKLQLAVNLSPHLLAHAALVQEISDTVARHQLRPEQLVLEITESSVVDGSGSAIGALARLRLKGFGLSIDDYGTGFSSMQQLSRIPFTELKIDRSFVHGAHQRSNLRVILQSALDMTRQLGLKTVAEGVETLEDWRLLQQSGCAIGQGYLISRPLSADQFLPWLKQHHGTLGALRSTTPRAA